MPSNFRNIIKFSKKMKNFKSLFVMGLLALLISGCGIGKMVQKYPDVSIKLENENLENKGGKVDYTIKGTVPPKYLKKKAALDIEVPFLIYNDETGKDEVKSVNKITLVGEKSKVKGIVIPYKAGGDFSKSGSFDYDENYLNAGINAVTKIEMGKQAETMPARLLGEGISDPASLITLDPVVTETDYDGKASGNGTLLLNAPHQYKPEFITKTAVIYFEVNQSNLNWNLKLNKNSDAKANIKEFVDFLFEGKVIDKVIVHGWASPEGEESKNQGLSEKRFEQGKKWFNTQFDKYIKDYAKKNKIKVKDVVVPEIVFENHAKGEDWSGFETAVEKSNIAEKNQILNVVRSQSNNEMREQKIREMTDIYNEIKEAILPPLRRSEISLICNKNNYNDEQIVELAISNPAELSLNERLYAAALINDNAQKETIYKGVIADETMQNDWRAYNNLAVLSLSTPSLTALNDAVEYLNKANAISPSNGIVLNNMGITAFFSGDRAEAKAKFEQAQSASVFPTDQKYNLGMYKILDGDYAGAINMMNNKHCDYNMALAQLVSKNYTEAKATLDCIPNKTADVYYLLAVLGARTQSQELVMTNLTSAIERNSELAAKAKKDPEFKKYRTIAEFKNIVK